MLTAFFTHGRRNWFHAAIAYPVRKPHEPPKNEVLQAIQGGSFGCFNQLCDRNIGI